MVAADGNSTTTKLLTLLNVSATRLGKRKWDGVDEFKPGEKINKRKSVRIDVEPTDLTVVETDIVMEETVVEELEEEEVVDDPYEAHFGCKPAALTDAARSAIDKRSWTTSTRKIGKLGPAIESMPEGSLGSSGSGDTILERLRTPFKAVQAKKPADVVQLQNDVLSALSSSQDLYITPSTWETKKPTREAIALHALNHVTKKRRRVLKNNERLSNAAKASVDPPEDVQDQGFTRPSVLILLPFRSSAMAWFHALTSHTPSPLFQIENQSRFLAEYGLPPDAVDKLASAEPGTYPQDHVETFSGNVDDNFRVGVKLTRKTIKMFTDFYGCDIILASPLGLRQSIQKEKGADYLSSIELLVIDQMEALTMQNWEHVKFVMSHLNKIPKESHDADFSRIKPWYLDGYSEYLRQSIFLSAYETPETRALYNNSPKNVAGKARLDKKWPPLAVPDGIVQDFIRVDCSNLKDEAEKRFQHFTTQVLPTVLKSAVQSANTAVIVPSSFDFIRVQNYFRKQSGLTFTVLSEYSSNKDISRARESFFSGRSSFVLISERFLFYKRYKIRGIRNLIFYGPTDNMHFYPELLSYPFLDDGVDSTDVTCRVLYSKYDWFKLERIAGTEGAAELVKS